MGLTWFVYEVNRSPGDATRQISLRFCFKGAINHVLCRPSQEKKTGVPDIPDRSIKTRILITPGYGSECNTVRTTRRDTQISKAYYRRPSYSCFYLLLLLINIFCFIKQYNLIICKSHSKNFECRRQLRKLSIIQWSLAFLPCGVPAILSLTFNRVGSQRNRCP